MDALDQIANEGMRAHFSGLHLPCPSKYCDGFLSEYDQPNFKPFKAFLVCPDCESRLRIFKHDKGWKPDTTT